MDRYCFVIAEYSYFYSHRYSLANFLSQNNFEVEIITNSKPKELSSSNIKIISSPFSRGNASVLNIMNELISLIRLFRSGDYHFIHFVSIRLLLIGIFVTSFLSLKSAKKCIFEISGLGSYFGVSSRFRAILLNVICRVGLPKHSVLLVQNEDDKKTLSDFTLGKGVQVVKTCGVGIDTARFSPNRRSSSKELLRIGFVGRLIKDKGIREFITAAAALRGIAIFNIYGEVDFKNRSAFTVGELKKSIELGVINYHGHLESTNIYSSLDVFCLPSYREGLPKALLEAMSCGLICVATDVPGCREIITDRCNGLLCKPRSPISLIDTLLNVVTGQVDLQTLRVNARETVISRYSEAVAFNRMLDILRSPET